MLLAGARALCLPEHIDCGLNGAMYFVQMDNDGGKSKYSKYSDMAGAKYGTGYCDAQCPHDMKWTHGRANVEGWVPSETHENVGKGKYGTCCTEIDLWEANMPQVHLSWLTGGSHVPAQT